RSDHHRTQQDGNVDGVVRELDVVLKVPIVDDGLRCGDGPKAVAEERRVGNQEKRDDPYEWRNRYGRFVSAGVHPTSYISAFSWTRVASLASNSNSTSPLTGPGFGTRARM